jgi:hypothetical protein
MFARLLAPFVVAVGLVAPATVTAAHAGPTDAQMAYTTQGTFAPHKTVARLSQSLDLTNLDATLTSHAFNVASATKSQSTGSLNFRNTGTVKPWSTASDVGTIFVVTVIGSTQQPVIAATVEIIP